MLHSQYVIIPFFFSDDTSIVLKYFIFYCQLQGWSNEDTHATRVWLFHKCLVSHLVEGFVRDVPNNKSNPNNKHTQANVLSMCAGETRLFTWSPVHAFHLRIGKQARKQAWPVSPRKERARWMAALVALCQSLLAAVALVSPKGPRQPGELSERRSWWWSESPGRITFDRAIWKCDSLFHLLDWSLTMAGGFGLALVKTEGAFLLSDGGFLSIWLLPLHTYFALQREGQLVDQNLSSHPWVYRVWPPQDN